MVTVLIIKRRKMNKPFTIRIKKLWQGKYASLRDIWIKNGIKAGALKVFYNEKSMYLNKESLESVLLSKPSQIISSMYKGNYKLYDVEFGKDDYRQTKLFQGQKDVQLFIKKEISPEVKLWRSVIKRAILDCCGIFEDSKFNNRLATRHRIIYEAESWFNLKEDLETICDYADIEPTNVIEIKENAKHYFTNSCEERSTLLSALLDRAFTRYK